MRRLMLGAVTLALAAGLATPAIAGNDDHQFEGLIERDENTYLGLNIDKQNRKRFIVDGIGVAPYTCVNSEQDYTVFGTGKRIRIDDRGRFKVSQPGPVLGGAVQVKISGKVNGRVIKGSVGWRFTDDTPDPSDDCYTGQLAYRVSRDDEFPPPFRTP